MPREKRKVAESGIYHAVVKGLNSQLMFEEPEDYRMYLTLLRAVKVRCHFELYAYCLMTNHIHIVLKETDHDIGKIFQILNTNYAVWFNQKYERKGHLQYARFFSEPIETEEYLVNAVNYVHQNPYKAGLETAPGTDYKWSSIYEYTRGERKLINIDELEEILPGVSFTANLDQEIYEAFIDYEHTSKRFADRYARVLILQETGCKNIAEFQVLSKEAKEDAIEHLYRKGLSKRQMQRLTGMSYRAIDNCAARAEEKRMAEKKLKENELTT